MPLNNNIYLDFWGAVEPLLLEPEANQRKSSSCLLLLEGTMTPPPHRSSGTCSLPECMSWEFNETVRNILNWLFHINSLCYPNKGMVFCKPSDRLHNTCRCQNVCNVPTEKNIFYLSIFWLRENARIPVPSIMGLQTALDRKPCCWRSTFTSNLSVLSTISHTSDMFVFSFILHCYSESFLDFTVFSKDC